MYRIISDGTMADSVTTPTELSATTGVTVNHPTDGGLLASDMDAADTTILRLSLPKANITLTQSVTVYVVPWGTMSTAANARVTVGGYARRIG